LGRKKRDDGYDPIISARIPKEYFQKIEKIQKENNYKNKGLAVRDIVKVGVDQFNK